MAMSKKDYVAIAAVFGGYKLQPQAQAIVRELAIVFSQDNSRFDTDKFIDACNTPTNFGDK